MAERGPRAARPYDSLLAGVSTACTSIAICGQGLSRSPSSCSSPAGPGAAIRAAALTLSGSGSRAATPRHAGPCPCSPTAASGTPAAAAAPLHSSSRAATPRRAILDSPYLCSPTAKSATHAATAMLLLHSSSSGSRSAALSPLHTGSRPLLPGGHFLPAMPHPHSPSAVQLSGQGSPSAAAAWRRPTSAVLPFRCPQEDRMGQGGETVAGTGTSEATHPHQTPPHQLPASSACAARLNPLLAPLRPPSQRSRSSVGSGTASPCPITRVGGGSGTSVSGILDCERSSVGRSSLLSCGSSRAHKSGTSVGGSLDCGGCSGGSRSLLSGGSTRICDNSANGGGCLECGGGSVITSSLLSYGSILLSGGSSSTRSLASHSPGSSHSGDASLRFASSPPVNTPLRYSTSPPVDALPHAAPPLLPCTQPETPPIDVVSGDAHAPAAAVGEIGAVGAAVAAAAAVGAKATNAGEAEVKATAADTAAGGSGQSSGRWTQLEAALTTAPPPAPWQSTLSQPQAARTHVPFACMHSPPGSPSLGLAQSQAELVYAQKPGQQQPLSQQQQQQQQQRQQQRQQQWQQQRQQPQAQHCTLCEQQCEGPQGQAKCGSSRGSSAGASRGCPEASCCSGASWSIEASGVLLANGATAGPAAVDTDLSSAAGDAGNQTPPVVANAAEGRLQQQPQVSEEQGGKGQTQPGITEGQSQPGITEGQSQPGITEGQSQPRPGVGEEGNTEPATLTKQQPQRRPEDGELGALEPQADEAGERSDAEAEGRVVEVEKGEEEVDGAVGRKKKRKAKGGKRALKASGSNTSNGSAGSTACGGPSNSSSRCGGSHGSIVSGGAGDVASGVGCGSRGSNVLRGVGDGSRGSHVSRGLGDGSRGSSRGSSGPAVADTQDGRNGCASTCSSGSGSARAGDSGKCATVPLQGPPNGPLSSNTGGPISIVGQGPSANLANPIGRASPSPGVVRGRSMSTGRGCGALQRTARLDGTSDTLRHRSGGASSSLHCSLPRTSRRSGAFNTMPLPPLAATQLPSRGFQDHSAFHTCVASVNSRFGPGEALVPRSGGSSGGRGSVAGVMGQAEGEAAGREVLDLREERRKAHERLEAYSKAKQAKAQEAAMEDANRRRAIQDARNAHKAAKERQREEVYALNAILRMSEQAFINQLLEAAARSVRRMSKDGHSQLEAAAEHAAAAAAAAASAGGAAVGHAAAAVVGAASARGTVAEYAAHAAATAAAADSAREPGAQSPEGSFSSSVHDSSSSVRQAAGASDAVVLGVGGVRGVESVGGSGGRSRPVSALVVLVAAAVSQPQSALGRALRAHPALPGSGVASGTTSIAAGAGGSTGGSTGRVTAGTADTVGIKAGAAAGPARGLVPGRNVAGAGGALDGDDVDDGFIAEDGEGSDEEQADVSLMQSILSRMAHGV